MAPIKPIAALRERQRQPSFIGDGLKELIGDMLQRDKDVFTEVARTSEIVANFIEGKQQWSKSYWSDEWKIRSASRADPNRVTCINIMQFYCTAQIKMFTASNPDLEPADEFRQKEYRQKVKIAKAVWNRYESRFYTPRLNQQEALHAIVSGNYIESVRYDHFKAGARAFREIFEDKRVQISEGHSRCFSCGFEGNYAAFTQDANGEEMNIPACPSCGSMEILPPEAPVEQIYRSVKGVEPVQCGDLDLRLIPVQAVRFDVRKPIEESSWAIERIRMEEGKLRWLLGDMDLQLSDVETDEGLNSLEAIARAGNTLSGHGSDVGVSSFAKPTVVDRVSFMPEDVAHIVANEDTPTVDGRVIPKGTRLSDLVPPTGATCLAVNDGALIIGLYLGNHHSREMSSGTYHMRFASGLGRGSEDTVEVQKRFNRNDAQITRYGEATATPAHTYVKGAVDRRYVKFIGHPQAAIPINKEVAMALKSGDVVRALPPGTIGAQFFQYTYDILNQYRQLTSHSTDFTNAFPGVENSTATGARLAKSNAESVFSPALQVKAFCRRGTAKNTLYLHAEHFKGVSMYLSFGETENKRAIGRHVKGEEVDPDIEFAVVRDSEQPKTMYDRQIDFVNMMNVAATNGGLPLIKQSDPKMAEMLFKAFDIDAGDETYTTLVDVCEERLDQVLNLQKQFTMYSQLSAQAGMPTFEMPPEAALMGLNPTIDVEEPNHKLKAKWYMDYLDCPDGFAMSNEERAMVRMLARTHAQMEAMQMALISQLASAATVVGSEPEREAALAEEQRRGQAEIERSDREEQMARDRRAEERDAQMAAEARGAENTAAQSILESGLRVYEAENQPAMAG